MRTKGPFTLPFVRVTDPAVVPVIVNRFVLVVVSVPLVQASKPALRAALSVNPFVLLMVKVPLMVVGISTPVTCAVVPL